MMTTAQTERKNRKAANYDLAALPNYCDGIPVVLIDAILVANGFRSLEEGIYCGRDGKINEQVGKHSWLSMTWHKMEITGRYEIVAYLS